MAHMPQGPGAYPGQASHPRAMIPRQTSLLAGTWQSSGSVGKAKLCPAWYNIHRWSAHNSFYLMELGSQKASEGGVHPQPVSEFSPWLMYAFPGLWDRIADQRPPSRHGTYLGHVLRHGAGVEGACCVTFVLINK